MFLVGAYGSALIVEGSFPATLRRLVLYACVRAEKPSEKVIIWVRVPGAVPERRELQVTPAGPMDAMSLQFVLEPCNFAEAGELRVDFEFEDGHQETGRIDVLDRERYQQTKW